MRKFFHRLIIPLVLLAVFSFISASRISFNVDPLDLLPPDLPEVEAFDRLMTNFSRKNELIITLEAKEDPFLAEDAMRSLVNFLKTQAGDKISSIRGELPLFEDPELGAELIAWLWLNGDPANLETLATRLDTETTVKKQLNEAMDELQSGFFSEKTVLLGYDPLELTTFGGNGTRAFLTSESNGFQSASGEFRMIYVEADVPEFPTYQDADAWVKMIRSSIDSWKKTAADEFDLTNLKINFTGEPVFVSEISMSMENDMVKSVMFTTILICVLFWLMHRQLKPLFWLVIMLSVVFSGTFAAGGLILGELSAMSIGFAAILIGLAVDYGVVLYRERAEANGDLRTLLKSIGPGIVWAAATTAAVFFSMNFSSLPGIRELGTLVALGILIGATVMLGLFGPVVVDTPVLEAEGRISPVSTSGKPFWALTWIAVVAGIGTILISGWPSVNRESRPFNLKNSAAMAAFDKVQKEMHNGQETLPVVVSGETSEALTKRLAESSRLLTEFVDSGKISQFSLPTSLAPNAANQKANREVLQSKILPVETQLIAAIQTAGFTEDATALTKKIFHNWTELIRRPETGESSNLPENAASQWLISRMIASGKGEFVALGELMPVNEETFVKSLTEMKDAPFQVAGWPVLTPAMHRLIEKDFKGVFLPMGLILVVMLMAVFRNWRDVCLSLICILFGALLLIASSLWFPIEWNFFNIMGIPILFGTGLDYGIHMIFALRRTKGDLSVVRQGIGKALLFCGCSTAVGFGSLSFAGTQGLSSLGVICGLGILLNMVTAVWLLPHWWRAAHAKELAAASS